mmetsp:Transcript_15274/g.36027  ORF Transcript_15274/g.36027 Transcript_15274/m.36027 type:complete len:647 (+) Transcript_15274:111-2051(+)|eukprot:CAMPEP_0114543116 /NCGR_PEP_ID=MMETSP0114-20121206/2187_1 /TAXON_ID=31324 /ORGANISM="Goniomonas sp, Strain m" /LENGTH=646 /DNA_ID=CAMNT_0001727439 /DNA_START=31 /DNA_END=1971 /DNA_ORIENTATION=-
MDAYEFESKIGAGSYAVVWKARCSRDGKIVAVKQLKDSFKTWDESLQLAEVKTLPSLNHPNVIKLHEVVKVKDQVFLVFQYCESNLFQTMQYMREQAKKFSEAEIRYVMKQILQGLEFCHDRDVFHRDIKPENVMLRDNELKLTDFGQAKSIRNRFPLTEYVATRWYRAPEIILRSRDYGPASDIWSAGALMAELYLLHPMFSGTSEIDQLFKICSVLGTPAHWTEGAQLAAAIGYNFPSVVRTGVASLITRASPSSVEAIEALIEFDPTRRPTASQALRLPFFSDGPCQPLKAMMPEVSDVDEKAARAQARHAMAALSDSAQDKPLPSFALTGGSPTQVPMPSPSISNSPAPLTSSVASSGRRGLSSSNGPSHRVTAGTSLLPAQVPRKPQVQRWDSGSNLFAEDASSGGQSLVGRDDTQLDRLSVSSRSVAQEGGRLSVSSHAPSQLPDQSRRAAGPPVSRLHVSRLHGRAAGGSVSVLDHLVASEDEEEKPKATQPKPEVSSPVHADQFRREGGGSFELDRSSLNLDSDKERGGPQSQTWSGSNSSGTAAKPVFLEGLGGREAAGKSLFDSDDTGGGDSQASMGRSRRTVPAGRRGQMSLLSSALGSGEEPNSPPSTDSLLPAEGKVEGASYGRRAVGAGLAS